jgi:hypothetical protein
VNIETKEQSKQWMHTHLANKPKTVKETLPASQKADGSRVKHRDNLPLPFE